MRLAAVFAHPDDESRITGGTLALYASRGYTVMVYCATRGEAGDPHRPPAEVAALRGRELEAACQALGVAGMRLRDYPDGRLSESDPEELAQDISRFLRDEQPLVVVTFGPDGRTGHPDHVAVSLAAERAYERVGSAPGAILPAGGEQRHRGPRRLFHTALARSVAERNGWTNPCFPDEQLVGIDVTPVLDRKRRASIESHASQWALSPFDLSNGWEPYAAEHFRLAAGDPLPEGARRDDLFEGLG